MSDDRIEIDGQVGFGRPRIRGTRVPLHVLFSTLSAGLGEAEVAQEYGIAIADVRAALAWVARLIVESHTAGGGETR